MLHHHPEKIEFLLGLAKDLNFTACVAGSCVYLPKGQEPSDIDIYIREGKKGDFKEFHEQLLCLDEFEDFAKETNAPKYGYANQVAGCKYAKFDGVEVNVLGLNPHYETQFFTTEVIKSFDYGIVQTGIELPSDSAVGYDILMTDECKNDRDNKTLTLLNVPSQYHLSKMGERLAKLQNRFPDHKVVITPDFYKTKSIKKKSAYTYEPQNFIVNNPLGQLDAARNALRAVQQEHLVNPAGEIVLPRAGVQIDGQWVWNNQRPVGMQAGIQMIDPVEEF